MPKARIILKLILITFLITLTFTPVLSFAQDTRLDTDAVCIQSEPGGICLPSEDLPGPNYRNFSELVTDILRIALFVVGLIAVVFMVIGGYRYIMAGGNEEGATAAKKTIANALIGLIIVLLAWAIVTVVSNLVIRGPQSGSDGSNPPCNPGYVWDPIGTRCIPN